MLSIVFGHAAIYVKTTSRIIHTVIPGITSGKGIYFSDIFPDALRSITRRSPSRTNIGWSICCVWIVLGCRRRCIANTMERKNGLERADFVLKIACDFELTLTHGPHNYIVKLRQRCRIIETLTPAAAMIAPTTRWRTEV